MENFDINKEIEGLQGLSIIEKCSALDDMLGKLEKAQEQIINAKDEITEEYASEYKKKFYKEISSLIETTFEGKIPYIDNYGYKFLYNNMPIYLSLFCTYGEWSIYLFVLSGSTKHLIKLGKVLGAQIIGNGASLDIEVTEKNLISKVRQIFSLSDSYKK